MRPTRGRIAVCGLTHLSSSSRAWASVLFVLDSGRFVIDARLPASAPGKGSHRFIYWFGMSCDDFHQVRVLLSPEIMLNEEWQLTPYAIAIEFASSSPLLTLSGLSSSGAVCLGALLSFSSLSVPLNASFRFSLSTQLRAPFRHPLTRAP